MSFSVVKPFKTVNRKFSAGDKIEEVDLADSVLGVSDLIAAGLIKADVAAAPAKPFGKVSDGE